MSSDFAWLIDWLLDLLTSSIVDWLINCLIDWLVDWINCVKVLQPSLILFSALKFVIFPYYFSGGCATWADHLARPNAIKFKIQIQIWILNSGHATPLADCAFATLNHYLNYLILRVILFNFKSKFHFKFKSDITEYAKNILKCAASSSDPLEPFLIYH